MEKQRREADNPFQPISLDERLSRPVSKSHTPHAPMMMRPGQLYGRTPFYQPAVMGSPPPPVPAAPAVPNAEPSLNDRPFRLPEARPQAVPPQPEPAFQPLWHIPAEWPSAEASLPPDDIPESQRPMEKDVLGVPRYLQRSPSLGSAPFHAPDVPEAAAGSAAAETPVSSAPGWPAADVPPWPMTRPAAEAQPEKGSVPIAFPAEESISAPEAESAAETEPASAPPLPKSEAALSTFETEKDSAAAPAAPRRRSRMARRAAAAVLPAETVSEPDAPVPAASAEAPAVVPNLVREPVSVFLPEKKEETTVPEAPAEFFAPMETPLEEATAEAAGPQAEPARIPSSEPLFSAAPRRAEKTEASPAPNKENVPPEAPAAEEDDWYRVFQQSGPLWDPDASPMGSELDAFFSDDAPMAEIHWSFNEDDPAVPSEESAPVSESDAPVFYPFELDSLPPEEAVPPPEETSEPLHGFDQPFSESASPSADRPFRDTPSAFDAFSWSVPPQSAVPGAPFHPGQPAPARPFAPKAVRPAGGENPSRPGQEKPPILWGRVAALLAVAAMLLFCLIAGGKILMSLSANEREMAQVRQTYQEQQGQALEQAGVRVDLLPAGETFTPTSTPQVFAAPKTEASQSGAGSSDASLPEAENIRTRLSRYPDNPLRNVLDSMKEIHAEYPDVLARLNIPGVLDEYVVQRNNTYYLTHNYRGSLSDGGAVFLDRDCAINTPPENLLLRGEGNVTGVSFAPLWQYQSEGIGFAAGACFAQLTTLYEDARYVLFSVIVADSDPARPGYFDYASHSAFGTDAQMMEYVQSAVDRSPYRFSVSVEPSDRLLTLATVSSRGSGKCLVLLFRMVRDGEATP